MPRSFSSGSCDCRSSATPPPYAVLFRCSMVAPAKGLAALRRRSTASSPAGMAYSSTCLSASGTVGSMNRSLAADPARTQKLDAPSQIRQGLVPSEPAVLGRHLAGPGDDVRQVRGRERLGDVLGAAGLPPPSLVVELRPCCEEGHRRLGGLGVLPKHPKDRQAAEGGQHHVEDDEVR